VLGGPDNRGAEGAEIETPKASRGEGYGEGVRKRDLVYLELEKSHLIATNLAFLTFLWHYI